MSAHRPGRAAGEAAFVPGRAGNPRAGAPHPVEPRAAAAIRGLVTDHTLTDAQADAVLAALRTAAPPPARGGWWIEALGYIGGGLLLAGAGTLVGLSWTDLGRAGQITVLAAATLLLAGAAIAVAGGPRGVRRLEHVGATTRRRVVGVLFALAAAGTAITAVVAVDRRADLVGPAAGLVAALAGYAALRTAPGLLACAGFGWVLTMDLFADEPLRVASVLIPAGAAVTALALAGALVPRALGLGIGLATALFGAQQPMFLADERLWAYLATAAVGVASLALYRWQRSLLFLLAGVAGVTLAVPEAVWDVTNGAGGAAAILLGSGAVLLSTSAVALRLHRRV